MEGAKRKHGDPGKGHERLILSFAAPHQPRQEGDGQDDENCQDVFSTEYRLIFRLCLQKRNGNVISASECG